MDMKQKISIPVVREYTKECGVSSDVRIVLISDLHGTEYGELLPAAIESLSPDIVAVCGDLADDVNSIRQAEALLSFSGARFPTFYVLGNHEFSGRIAPQMLLIAKRRGVRVLRGACAEVHVGGTSVAVCGMDDLYVGKEKWMRQARMLESRKAEGCSILLAHRPDYLKTYLKGGYDLVLCGHTHGGQIRLPGINGLYAPGQGIFPRHAGGRYDFGNTTLIVGRGLVQNHLPRWGNPPEIALVTLRPRN